MKRFFVKTLRPMLAGLLAAGMAALSPVTAWADTASALDCSSAILIEADSGMVLFEYNADDRHAPASITKIMTMLLVMEDLENGSLSLEDKVTTSSHASSMGGSQIWLEPYEQMTVDEMLRATAIGSANDAAVALAEHVSGTESAFVDRMNARAAELGMDGTHFVNACGLDEEGHYTTARDIAAMSAELLRHDAITDYTSVWQDTLRDGETELVNTNRLVRFYDGCNGLKTGTTDDAGYCVSASAEKDGMTLIAVVLGARDSETRFASAKSLLDYGFSSYCRIPAPDISADLADIPVRHGTQRTVTPVADAPDGIVIEKAKRNQVIPQISPLPEVEAPVEQGQELGKVILTVDGKIIAEYAIIAEDPVARMDLSTAFRRLLAALCSGSVE